MHYSTWQPATPSPWWWQSLTNRQSLACLGVLVLGTLVVAVGLSAVLALRRGRALTALAAIPKDNQGTATLEFALVFPIILFMVMLLAQTTMLMGGNLYVHYAAYCATRAAIVQVPTTQPSSVEQSDTIVPDPDSPKFAAIQNAAFIAVMPVCGRLSAGSTSTNALVSGFQAQYQSYGQPAPNWVSTLLADQYRYACANTTVTVRSMTIPPPGTTAVYADLPPDMPYTFAPHEPITVRVSHQFNLGVPYVNAIFSDGTHTPATGSGRYATIIAQTTLTNEGVVDQIFPPSQPRMN